MSEAGPHLLEPGGTEFVTNAGGARRYRKPITSFRWCDIRALLAESFTNWSRHKAPRLGAALAFYTLLSITPMLLVVVAVGGLAFGQKAAQSEIIAQIQDVIGPQGAQAIQALLEGTHKTTHGIAATLLGLITLLFGASGVLIELRDALNTIWEVPTPETTTLQSILTFFKERLFSFALVLAIGFILLVSLAVNAWIAALGTLSAGSLPIPEVIMHLVNSVVSFLIVTGLFAAI